MGKDRQRYHLQQRYGYQVLVEVAPYLIELQKALAKKRRSHRPRLSD